MTEIAVQVDEIAIVLGDGTLHRRKDCGSESRLGRASQVMNARVFGRATGGPLACTIGAIVIDHEKFCTGGGLKNLIRQLREILNFIVGGDGDEHVSVTVVGHEKKDRRLQGSD